MTLAEVRLNAVKASRRTDLITNGDLTTNTDAGMNRFINSAVNYLSLWMENSLLVRRFLKTLAADEYTLTVPRLIRVDKIEIVNDEGRNDITAYKSTPGYLREVLHSASTYTPGQPLYWAIAQNVLSDSQKDFDATDFDTDGVIEYGDISFGDDFLGASILFSPKADATYTVDILGKFLDNILTADADVNFLSSRYPEELILATCYMIERTMGVQTRTDYWMRQLQVALNLIDDQQIEEEMPLSQPIRILR